MEKSILDVAFELVSKKKTPIVFMKLWEEVSQVQGLTEEETRTKAAKFYTALTLDGRFITLGDNTWDLRSRHTFDKVHIDMNAVYSDDYDYDNDEEENEEDSEEDELYDEDESEDEEDEDLDSEDY